MSSEETKQPKKGPPCGDELTPAETDFLDFLADRALAEWLKRPPANDNNEP